MKINSQNDSNHANLDLAKTDVSSEIFSPHSSSSGSPINKGKNDFNFLFNSRAYPTKKRHFIFQPEKISQGCSLPLKHLYLRAQ